MSFTLVGKINWADPKMDNTTGQTTSYCTFTAKDEDGNEKIYKVTAKYNKKGLESGYEGDVDEQIQKVIEATINVFPKLVGTTISFKLGSDDDKSTVIKKHTNKDYEGKTLEEIADDDEELYENIKQVTNAFYDVFKKLKKDPVDLEVSNDDDEITRTPDLKTRKKNSRIEVVDEDSEGDEPDSVENNNNAYVNRSNRPGDKGQLDTVDKDN